LSDEYAKGRVISILEGGYSDRALISGAMAHLAGLVDVPASLKVDEDWWSVENLIKVSHAGIFVQSSLIISSSSNLRQRSVVAAGLHSHPKP
jgi:hypothetical protein